MYIIVQMIHIFSIKYEKIVLIKVKQVGINAC